MLNLKAIAVAAALTLSTAGFALAAEGSAMDALGSASTVNFKTVTAAELNPLSPGYELVDLDSLAEGPYPGQPVVARPARELRCDA